MLSPAYAPEPRLIRPSGLRSGGWIRTPPGPQRTTLSAFGSAATLARRPPTNTSSPITASAFTPVSAPAIIPLGSPPSGDHAVPLHVSKAAFGTPTAPGGARLRPPPTYRSVPRKAIAITPSIGTRAEPRADQASPSHLAMALVLAIPATSGKLPPTYTSVPDGSTS